MRMCVAFPRPVFCREIVKAHSGFEANVTELANVSILIHTIED